MKNVIILTIAGVLLGVVSGVIMSVLLALPVMWLWNWLMPKLFGLITINIWEALGVVFLSGLLFKTGDAKVETKG